jgi:hypothetical protein
MNIEFVKQYLSNVKWNNENADWQVSGIIKNLSNQYLKFDIRFLKDLSNNKKSKFVPFKSDADKVLFETDKEWVLIDTQEFIRYMKENRITEIKLEELIKNIDWNIILPKK